MIRAVLDANVFVSAVLSSKGVPAQILTAWRANRFHLVTSEAILQEIDRVLHYPKIGERHRWTKDEIKVFVGDLARLAIRASGERTLRVISRDPSDNRYLECAIQGDAEYLVSGDQHLLQLGAYQKIRIVTPRDFLDVVRETPKP